MHGASILSRARRAPMNAHRRAALTSQCEVCRAVVDAARCAAIASRVSRGTRRAAALRMRRALAAAGLRRLPARPAAVRPHGLRGRLRISLGRADRRLQVQRPGRARLAARRPRCAVAVVQQRDAAAGLARAGAAGAAAAGRTRLQPGVGDSRRRLAPPSASPPVHDLLWRPCRRPHQAGLGRAERRRNLRGAFMVDPRRRARPGRAPRRAGRRRDDHRRHGRRSRRSAAARAAPRRSRSGSSRATPTD